MAKKEELCLSTIETIHYLINQPKYLKDIAARDLLTKDGLAKETYVWVASNFGNTSSVANPIVLDALASCYAKGGDYKTAVTNQERALELAKKALKDGSMVGTIMCTMREKTNHLC